MTNWPNIQEYRNFGAKFYDNSIVCDDLNGSVTDGDESVRTNQLIDREDWTSLAGVKPVESKTVRCVIKKDFEEAFKKFDRGDGLNLNLAHSECGQKPKAPESQGPIVSSTATAITTDRRSTTDQLRLENHLRWMKQKEEEFQQRKLAEKLAQQKRKEEEAKLEKIRKQRERESEEKLREWQEQKAREKEGKKREKIVLKVLEEELKEATPVIDKEKLIEDWVKLKDRQKQIEAEKKAEILKREEESRALRQSLAALSYQQWMEKVKGKNTALPKNGYQIFGPKPKPVVKEDWNNDFTSNSPRRGVIGLVGSKSNTTTNLVINQPGMKELENLSKDFLGLGDLKRRSPSFYHLKNVKSGLDLRGPNIQTTPLKELQVQTKTKKGSLGNVKGAGPSRNCNLLAREKTFAGLLQQKGHHQSLADDPSFYLPLSQDELDSCDSPPQRPKTGGGNGVPMKKKIDLYINPPLGDGEDGFQIKFHKKPSSNANLKSNETKKVLGNRVIPERDLKTKSGPKRSFTPVRKKTEPVRVCSDAHINSKKTGDIKVNDVKKPASIQPAPNKKAKVQKRSRSYDKPAAKNSKENVKEKSCTGSKSLMKLTGDRKTAGPEGKTKTPVCQRRKTRKTELTLPLKKPNSAGALDKKRATNSSSGPNNAISIPTANNNPTDAKKKPKKKPTKSYSFSDSPYCVKKTSSKNLDSSKSKPGRRKTAILKEAGEMGKGDVPGKWSTRKIP